MEIQNSDDKMQPNDCSLPVQTCLVSLEQENALLRSRLKACEQSCASSQPEINSSEHRLLEATAKATNALLTISPSSRQYSPTDCWGSIRYRLRQNSGVCFRCFIKPVSCVLHHEL